MYYKCNISMISVEQPIPKFGRNRNRNFGRSLTKWHPDGVTDCRSIACYVGSIFDAKFAANFTLWSFQFILNIQTNINCYNKIDINLKDILAQWIIMPCFFLTKSTTIRRVYHHSLKNFFSNDIRMYTEEIVRIGKVSKRVSLPKTPSLVPSGFLPSGNLGSLPHSLTEHLRWCLQKDILGQDMFLVGGPGPARRVIALAYCELTRREVDYLSLSRDTTESDLKQRREIVDGSGIYVDQPAVRAALEGRVLLLDGIERAERNVLPLIHNLLENREMRLEDGRFLLSPSRFDKLRTSLSIEKMKEMGLERVSEEFRVIALGLPVPPYKGHTLDPPLRSRFQARIIPEPPFKELLDSMTPLLPNLNPEHINSFLSLLFTLQRVQDHTLGISDATKLPTGPIDIPFHQVRSVLAGVDARQIGYAEALRYLLPLAEYSSKQRTNIALLTRRFKLDTTAVGKRQSHAVSSIQEGGVVITEHHSGALLELERLYGVGDLALVGGRGSGKSLLIDLLSRVVGQQVTELFCYKDMTARDLLQQRVTDAATGNTWWKNAPLIEAGLRGEIAVLDGLHRLDPSTLAALQSLVMHRFASLPDGTRVISADHHTSLRSKYGLTEQELEKQGVLALHPNFRIIGLTEPPIPTQVSPNRWLGSEALSMFQFLSLPELSPAVEKLIMETLHPSLRGSPELSRLLQLANSLRENKNDNTSQSLSQSLSTRQLLRIARRLAGNAKTTGDVSLPRLVKKACLYRFLTPLARNMLDEQLSRHGITGQEEVEETRPSLNWSEYKSVGQEAHELALVPDIVFFENEQQQRVLDEMLCDYVNGEHLLLVGNQGVGKNKLADRLLQRLSRPREYIQLHRDSTVQSLTTQPLLTEGRLHYRDSPLVRAARLGYTLVVDEADKAPLHVTAVLKGLVEGRGINLPDGRRVLPSNTITHVDADSIRTEREVEVHPEFRMIVLANRPGFPFMGNNFFANMGDLFSTHAIDNPDLSSEMSLVKKYAPRLSDDVIKRLLVVMQELRRMADEGQLRYPYSTRESVAVAEHLSLFPEEGLATAVRNVFDFDSFDKETQRLVIQVLHKHGIPLGASHDAVRLATLSPLPLVRHLSTWSFSGETLPLSPPTSSRVRASSPFPLPTSSYSLDRSYHRGQLFTEVLSSWSLPLETRSSIRHLSVSADTQTSSTHHYLHLTSTDPVCLYTMQLSRPGNSTQPPSEEQCLLLSKLFYCYRSARGDCELTLCPLTHPFYGQIILFEAESQSWLWADPISQSARWINALNTPISALTRMVGVRAKEGEYDVIPDPGSNSVLFYSLGGSKLHCLLLNSMQLLTQKLPFNLRSLSPVGRGKWIATDSTSRAYLCKKKENSYNLPYLAQVINMSDTDRLSSVLDMECTDKTQRNEDDARCNSQLLFSAPHLYAGYTPCSAKPNRVSLHERESTSPRVLSSTIMPQHSIVLNLTAANEKGDTTLEAVDLDSAQLSEYTLRKLNPDHTYSNPSTIDSRGTDYQLATVPDSNDVILTDRCGHLLQLELAPASLDASLSSWREMVGAGADREMRVSRERFSGEGVKSPKYGRVDPSNAPHIGGNTWAGGTGGRDTTGLGGKGGPYRLDAGHQVYQLSDEEKRRVPDEVTRAAKDLGRKAFEEKMKEIGMSNHDAVLYQNYVSKVERQIATLKEMLTALRSKGSERSWLRHQTTGDLDDSKLVDSISGERNVFMRREEEEEETGTAQSEPKRMRLVVDVSGSMYRFNSMDGRLEKSMESVLMVLEAFKGFEEKVLLEITGHSGDHPKVEFMKNRSLPANDKERLTVLREMLAHSQYCWSGDHTMEATERAVSELAREEGDQHFLVVLSDANFDRYGIDPQHYGALLISEPRVSAFVIFIGSLGDQAARLKETLPPGKAYVCLDTKDIPNILGQIFAASLE